MATDKVSDLYTSMPKKVYDFLVGKTPNAACGDCIVVAACALQEGALPVITDHEVELVANMIEALALTTDFEKYHAKCSICRQTGTVYRHLRVSKSRTHLSSS